MEGLVFFRVIQDLGGGMVLPLTLLVLAREAGPDRLGRVMSVVVVMIGQIAPFAGPVFGGALIEALGWRWIFFVNVPLCLISLAMTWRWFPRDELDAGLYHAGPIPVMARKRSSVPKSLPKPVSAVPAPRTTIPEKIVPLRPARSEMAPKIGA